MLHQVKEWIESGAKLFERRGVERVDTPIECFVTIDGRQHPLKNWSATGFLAGPYDGDLKENRGITVRIAIRHEQHDFVLDARAVVVRRDAGGLAARFIAIPPQSQKLMDDYFSHFLVWLRVTR